MDLQRDSGDVDSERIVNGATAAMIAAAFLIMSVMCWHMSLSPARAGGSDMPAQTLAFQKSMTLASLWHMP